MSFPVAVQSAIFYVLACTPCHKWSDSRTKDAEARRQHKAHEKARIEAISTMNSTSTAGSGTTAVEGGGGVVMEQPKYYPQPIMRMTNHWWGEDISMGPRLDRKRKRLLGKKKPTAAQTEDGKGTATRGRSFSDLVAKTTNQSEKAGEAAAAEEEASSSAPPVASQNPVIVSPPSPTSSQTPAHLARSDSASQTTTTPSPTRPAHPRSLSAQSHSSFTTTTATNTLFDERESSIHQQSASTAPSAACPEKDIWRKGWNHIRYDREDEPLWGHDMTRAGQRFFREAWEGGSRKVAQGKAGLNQWMLQPPPTAKVMSGKVPVSRDGSLMEEMEEMERNSVGVSRSSTLRSSGLRQEREAFR